MSRVALDSLKGRKPYQRGWCRQCLLGYFREYNQRRKEARCGKQPHVS